MQRRTDPLIFIVEDNLVYNKLIVNYLHSKRFNRIESFLSGEECLKRMNEKPDIVIQDYLLEGIDGIEVLKATKKKFPHTEFIFLSGQDSVEVAINSMKLGAFDYIVKDQLALKKMVDKISKIIAMQNLAKSNKRYKAGIALFFVALAAIILILIGLSIIYPDKFDIWGS
ncbi:MAG: response regulator [Bacteroidetes bacterium]|nr:response regulator [Bacteroidota bacterium]MCL6102944.1 response regulator [Bacteroidota bacterium]